MNNDLINFIKYSVSQKEVSLIVTKDEKEIREVIKTLIELGYHSGINVLDILEHISRPSKIFVTVKDDFSKDIYDFVTQYPTGQIEIYDKEKLKAKMVTPIYKDVSIIIIANENLIKKSNFQILEKIGLTFRGNL